MTTFGLYGFNNKLNEQKIHFKINPEQWKTAVDPKLLRVNKKSGTLFASYYGLSATIEKSIETLTLSYSD